MPEMKNSGIEWIGEIPVEWKVIRVKDKYYFDTGFTPDTQQQEYYSDENGFEWATISDVKNGKICYPTKSLISRKYVNMTHKKPMPIGCLLYSFKLSVGETAITDRELFTNEAIACFHPDEENNIRFLKYSSSLIEYNANTNIYGAKILNQQLINDAYIVFPPLHIQERIAKFLDKKCNKIDELSNDIQKEIETLEEYKKAIIFELLTHGINNEELHESNSDVWGQIPKSWKIKDIKYVFEIVKRIAGKEGYDILSVTQNGLKVKDISNNEGQIAADYSGYQFVYPTDYVMNHMDLLTGWVDCSTMFGVTSPDYRVFRLLDKKNNNLTYFKYLMQCCYLNKIFYSLGQGVSNLGRWRLQTSTFMNFKIPVPPMDEQEKIAEYLDKKCLEIDGLIKDKKEQLEVLEQYKKSIIFEYVTGKKTVTEE